MVTFPSTLQQRKVTWKWFACCWSVILPLFLLRTRYVDLSWYCFEYDLSALLYRLFLISDHITLFLISSSSQHGRVPIHLSAMYGRVEVVRFLLECDPSTVSLKSMVSWCELILLWMWSLCRSCYVVCFSYLIISLSFLFLPLNSLVTVPSTLLQWKVT